MKNFLAFDLGHSTIEHAQ